MKLWLKYVLLLTYIVLLTVIGTLIAVFGPYQCVRKACVRKAKFISKCMDVSANPCHDFYQFSCGNYEKMVKYRKKGVASVMDHIKLDIEELIDKFLNTQLNFTDNRLLKIVKKMFQPCKSTDLVNLQSVGPLWNAIWMSGGYPAVDGDQWSEEGFSLDAIESKSRRHGFSGQHLFRASVIQDKKSPEDYLVHIQPPQFGEFPGYEIVTEPYSDHLRSQYLSFIVRLTSYISDNPDYEKEIHEVKTNKMFEELDKTIDFKITLEKHISMCWKIQDPVDLYNVMSLQRLQNEFPYVDWKGYLQNMLPPSTKLPKKVVVIGTNFFKSIRKTIETTPKRIIANYFMLENIFESCLFLPSVYFAIYNKFRTNIKLSYKFKDIFCEDFVKLTLRGAFSSLFIQTYNLTERSQPILEEIAKSMRRNIKESIKGLTWMDDKSKERALQKLKKLKLTLSLSDEQLKDLQDEEEVAEYYEDLCLGTRVSEVLPAYFCVKRFQNKRNWELLNRRATVFDEDINVITTSITYIQNKNEILIPYSILKYPSFDGVWPSCLNFGGIGSILGNVLSTGYDITGSKYNDVGFINNWWTSNTTDLYNKHCECLRNQFVKYLKEKTNYTMKHKDKFSEHVALFEGSSLAYHAYMEHLDKSVLKDPSLPGLERFTSQQLFFIGFANIHCSFYKVQKLKNIIERGIQIPYGYQVIGSLENSHHFSEAFNCKTGSLMNPKQKCKLLWKD